MADKGEMIMSAKVRTPGGWVAVMLWRGRDGGWFVRQGSDDEFAHAEFEDAFSVFINMLRELRVTTVPGVPD